MVKRNIKSILLFLSFTLLISLASCDPAKKYEKEEKTQIQDYLAKNNNLSFVLMPSGLYYLETFKGTGVSPVANDSAFVKYTEAMLDGTSDE